MTNKQLINSIAAYSLINKKANRKPPYSTLYPATNSASASIKSNGTLFVSAKIHIKNKIAKGNKTFIYQVV